MNKLKNIFHKKKENKKITYEDITIDNLKAEIHRVKYKNSFSRLLRSTVYVLIIIVAISSICATLFMPVIEITDSSMKPLLNDGDIVLTVKENKFKTGDIVAFYHGNKILIKRVIGVESDFVNIDKDGIVYVNGKELKENYVKELKKGDSDIKYPVQVSDGSIFVLSDERDVLTDSRTLNVGQIKTNDIIGKVIFKVWPLKEIKKI
jgi:signal peptidase I